MVSASFQKQEVALHNCTEHVQYIIMAIMAILWPVTRNKFSTNSGFKAYSYCSILSVTPPLAINTWIEISIKQHYLMGNHDNTGIMLWTRIACA